MAQKTDRKKTSSKKPAAKKPAVNRGDVVEPLPGVDAAEIQRSLDKLLPIAFEEASTKDTPKSSYPAFAGFHFQTGLG